MKGLTKYLSDTTLLFAAMLIVNAGNYALNLVLGRLLGPVAFAEVSVIATIVLMLSFVAIGLQLTSAKFVAEAKTKSEETSVTSWLSSVVWRWSDLSYWVTSVFQHGD